jgi:hypothetical protein
VGDQRPARRLRRQPPDRHRRPAPDGRRRLADRGRRHRREAGRRAVDAGHAGRPVRQGALVARQPRAVHPFQGPGPAARPGPVRAPGRALPRLGRSRRRTSTRGIGAGGPVTVAPLPAYDYVPQPGQAADEALEAAYGRGRRRFLLHPDLYPDRAAWCHARVRATARLAALPAGTRTVLVNHWPLTRLPTRSAAPQFAIWCTELTADWHPVAASAVVYGTCIRADVRGRVRFECRSAIPRSGGGTISPRRCGRLPAVDPVPEPW